MTKANADLRAELKQKKIPLWEIGLLQGVNEVTMVRRFRVELSQEQKSKIRKLISEIECEKRKSNQC